MEPTGETIEGSAGQHSAREDHPLVVVLSEATADCLGGLADAGWEGPVLIVGSVAEAREVLDGGEGPALEPRPRPAAPHRAGIEPARSTGLTPGVEGRAVSGPVMELGRLRLDADQRRVINAPLAESLTPLEFGVLEALLRQPGRVQRFSELIRSVWGVTYTGDSSQLHAVVRRLRGKLELVRSPVQLCAVRGVGFRLAPTTTRGQARLGGALASI